MFCKNCGKEIDNKAAVCINCGVAVKDGNSFCPNCGSETAPGAAVCVNCGIALNAGPNENSKSKLVAGLLGIFLGGLGVHNFYLGYTKKAVAQLLICLLGSCLVVGPLVAEVWGLIEGIQILTGHINVDGNGNPLKD